MMIRCWGVAPVDCRSCFQPTMTTTTTTTITTSDAEVTDSAPRTPSEALDHTTSQPPARSPLTHHHTKFTFLFTLVLTHFSRVPRRRCVCVGVCQDEVNPCLPGSKAGWIDPAPQPKTTVHRDCGGKKKSLPPPPPPMLISDDPHKYVFTNR